MPPADRRPRLLVLAVDFPPAVGGIQRYTLRLAEELAQRWRVTVVAPNAPGACAHDRWRAVQVLRTRLPWRGRSRAGVLAEMGVRGRRERADVVVATHLAAVPAALAAAAGAPTAGCAHGSELWSPHVRRTVRLAGSQLARLVAVSAFTAHEAVALGVPRRRIHVVPPGADPPEPPADGPQRLAALGLTDRRGEIAPFFLSIARLSGRYKGHERLVGALPPLLAREPGLRLVIVGDGPQREGLAQLARSIGVSDSLVMAGPVNEPTKATLLERCLAFAMLPQETRFEGQFEGFGIVFLEAAMAGRPVIAARSGGIPDAVEDGATGLLVDPARPAEVVEAALRLLDDPAEADALGARGRDRALSGFTWPRIADRVDAVLQELLAKRG